MRIQILILGFKGLLEPPVARWFKSIRTRTQIVASSILTCQLGIVSELSGVRNLILPTDNSEELLHLT